MSLPSASIPLSAPADLTRIAEHNAFMQQVLDTLPSMLTVSEAIRNEQGQIVDFRIINANQPAMEAFGRPVEAVIGQLASVVFPQDRHNGVYDAYVKAADTRQSQQVEVSVTMPNGQVRWLDARLTYVLSDRVTASVLDITPLKEAQLTNQYQAETLRHVMDATPTAIVLHEAIRDKQRVITDFRLTMVNQLAADWMQETADSLADKRLSAHFPGIWQSPIFATYCQVVETGEPTRYEQRVGGTWYDFSVVKSGDGCIVAAIDITETHRQRQQLEQANTELTRSNDNLQQFAYVASHDLQEPLRKIQSFSEVLTNQFSGQLSGEGVDLLQRMRAAAARMSLLISDLLDYSRVSTHWEPLRRLSLDAVLKETLDDLWLLIQENKATITADPLPDVTGDQRQLKQLFQNLLTNAIKFKKLTHPPVIRIAVRQLDKAHVSAQWPVETTASQLHEISFSDNGIGFDVNHADRIFQVFQRLHGRTKYAGTGVGLAICRKVVENHGGTISVESTVGEGSTFRVYLPK